MVTWRRVIAREFLVRSRPGVPIVLIALGCNASDLSASLASGRCDAAGRCAAGYVCDQKLWECVPLGEGPAGGTGPESKSSSTTGTSAIGGSAGGSSLPFSSSKSGGTTFASGGATGGTEPVSVSSATGGTTLAAGGAQGGTHSASSWDFGGTFANGGVSASSVGGIAGTGGIGTSAGGSFSGGTSSNTEGGLATSGGSVALASTTSSTSGGESNLGGTTAVQGTSCTQDGCPCGTGRVLCGGTCLELTGVQHCGACSNRCDLAGSTLACEVIVQPTCSCAGDDSRCGSDPAEARCAAATGLCLCNGVECARGEICRPDSKGVATCSCDGASTCSAQRVCCQGRGCVNPQTDELNCGACGQACPEKFRCESGICRCGNSVACDAAGGG